MSDYVLNDGDIHVGRVFSIRYQKGGTYVCQSVGDGIIELDSHALRELGVRLIEMAAEVE